MGWLKLQSNKLLLISAGIIAVLAIVIIALIISLAQNRSPDCGLASETVMTSPSPTTTETPPWAVWRLPNNVRPSHYDLTLQPHLEEGSFSGAASIAISVSEPISRLLFNAHYLNISSVRVERPEGSSMTVKKYFTYDKSEVVVIETEKLQPGNYTVHFEYTGSLIKDLVGFYRASYIDPQTKARRFLATSKFEPTYARRAFPCYDEPNYKATYTVNLKHDKDYHGLSNMDIKDVSPLPGSDRLLMTRFHTSVPMSTYLVAFTVSDFKSTTTKTKDGKPFSSYSQPSQVNKTKYATDFGAKIQDFYAEYFDVPYPLPKQGMIAVPDFLSGAMENWGLISYRELALLHDKNQSSLSSLISVSKVIAHEITHQWFGNLVTMDWWDDLWLNEGFATFMAYKGIKQFNPNWDTDAFFQTNEVHSALSLDAMVSSHAIVPATITHPDDITASFDTISYSKGSSVLRMLEDFMGEKNFQKGLQKYLKKFQFKNTRTEDLWQCLTEVSQDLNIKQIMNTWTEQQGFPVITVTSDDQGTLHVTQQHFLVSSEKSQLPESKYEYKWEVPLSYVTETKRVGVEWMHRQDKVSFRVPDWTPNQWIKFNWKQKGFYRVNYSDSMWKRFSTLLLDNPEVLSAMDRSGLLDDAFTLASAGKLSYTTALSLTRYLSKEKEYMPWTTVLWHLGYLSSLLENTEAFPLFRNYVIGIIQPIYDLLKWENHKDNHMNSILQSKVLSFMCRVGADDCLSIANQRLLQWLENPDINDPNFQSIVFKYGIVTASPSVWESMWKRYNSSSNPEEKRNILQGLAYSPYTWQLHWLLRLTYEEKNIASQDYFIALQYMSNNPTGLPIVWHFIRDNWDYLVKRFSLNSRYLGNTVSRIASSFTTQSSLKEIREFFEKYPEGGAGTAGRRKAIDKIQKNVEWLSVNQQPVLQWLQNYNQTSS